jgi:hypothetical protein
MPTSFIIGKKQLGGATKYLVTMQNTPLDSVFVVREAVRLAQEESATQLWTVDRNDAHELSSAEIGATIISKFQQIQIQLFPDSKIKYILIKQTMRAHEYEFSDSELSAILIFKTIQENVDRTIDVASSIITDMMDIVDREIIQSKQVKNLTKDFKKFAENLFK